MRIQPPQLIAGKRLTRNSALSLFGHSAPLVAAFFAVPILIGALGEARFGLLAIVWMLIGYFSLFDLGVGRALAHEAAQVADDRDLAAISGTGLTLTFSLGIVGSLVLLALGRSLLTTWLALPVELAEEAVVATRWIAVGLPFVICSVAARSILEGRQEFAKLTLIRIPLSTYSFLAPLAVLPFTLDLAVVAAVLVAGRVVGCLAHLVVLYRVVPRLLAHMTVRREIAVRLLGFGGWMTVSNIIAPLMLCMDRFVIAGALSVTAVAYYTTAFDVVTKLWLVPAAVMSVLFPAMSTSWRKAPEAISGLYRRTVCSLGVLVGVGAAVVVVAAPAFFSWWVSPEFSQEASPVARIIAVGVFFHTLGQPAFALIQAAGHPRLTACIHLCELPLYLLYLLPLVGAWGITGAATAWLIRVSLSTIILTVVASRLIRSRTEATLSCNPMEVHS